MPLEDLQAPGDAFGRHLLGARRGSVDVAMTADLVAQPGDVDLQRLDRNGRQVRRTKLENEVQSTSFFRWFCICTECTSVIPACITAATCTASIICSGLAPVSRHCVV